jgi:hypothetical protein
MAVAGTERAATSDPDTEHRTSGGAVRVVKRGQGFEAVEDRHFFAIVG